MKAIIHRFASEKTVTLGTLRFQNIDHPTIYTLELPWRDNQTNISCIPKGNYRCAPYTSDKYPDVYQILNVPARTSILFHSGNYPHHTDGCILPGKFLLTNKPMVTHSKDTIDLIKNITNYEEFDLIIKGR